MENVYETAVKFIEQNKKDDPRVWNHLKIAGSSNEIQNVFWWNNTIRLYDIPLENKKTMERAGYLLVSESKELPPVVEYATEGVSLKEQIDQMLQPALSISHINATPRKYHFVSSTELYVSLEDVNSKEEVLLNIPNFFILTKDVREELNRQPSEVFSTEMVARYWEELNEVRTESLPSKTLNAKPTQYQQNCSSYTFGEVCTIDRSSNNSPCHPRKISGCVPVAWAMLLSALKRTNISGHNKIWQGNTCWTINWPSHFSTSNPSQCNVVEQTIWKLHTLMETTDNGSTKDSNTIKGKEILKDFGLTWKMLHKDGENFAFLQKIIDGNEPFLFDGHGKWGDDKAGHGVVVYGYKQEGNMMKVSLGWGKAFPDKWMNFDQFSSKGFTYRENSKTQA